METLKSSMAPSSPMSSVPLKKRSPETVLQDEKEEAAAAALAALSSSPKATTTSGLDLSKPREDPSGNMSDSEESYSSQNKVLPKAVHAPPLNSMMVDHTYTDYSVVKESSLAFLEEGEEPTSKMSEEERKKYTRRIAKVKKIFGEVVPSKKNSGGVVKPFPEKLMEVLDRADMEAIISWMPHGRAFVVLQPQQLRDNVLPRFFKQTKFMSFTRQLNLWGFKRITKGDDAGAYYHELFLRGRPRLAMLMRRQKIKGTGIKLTPNPETEPNFYKISEKRPLPAVDPSKRKNKPLPPLRQNPQARGFDPASNALEYNRMVQNLNNRAPPQDFDHTQIYPFSNNSNNSQGLNGGNVGGGNSNAGLNRNTLAALAAAQGGLGRGLGGLGGLGDLTQNSLAGLGLNGGMGAGLGLGDSLALQQLLLSNHLSSGSGLGGSLGLNSNVNDLALQQLLRQRQLQSNNIRENDTRDNVSAILEAQRLLSQVNRSSGGNMGGGDASDIQNLKQRLLDVANSLDDINSQPRAPQPSQVQGDALTQALLSRHLLGQQQLSQGNNNNDLEAMLNAIQNQRLAAAQAQLDQGQGSNDSNGKRRSF